MLPPSRLAPWPPSSPPTPPRPPQPPRRCERTCCRRSPRPLFLAPPAGVPLASSTRGSPHPSRPLACESGSLTPPFPPAAGGRPACGRRACRPPLAVPKAVGGPHDLRGGCRIFKRPPAAGALLSAFAALQLLALAAPPLVRLRAPPGGDVPASECRQAGNGATYGAVPGGRGDGYGAAAVAAAAAATVAAAQPSVDGRLPLMLFSHGLAGSVCGDTAACTALDAAGDGELAVAAEHAEGSAFATQVTAADGWWVAIPFTSFDAAAAAAAAGGHADERACRAAQVEQRAHTSE